MTKLCADTCGAQVTSAVVCQWRKSLEGRGESLEKKGKKSRFAAGSQCLCECPVHL